jgi:hypothetical protein
MDGSPHMLILKCFAVTRFYAFLWRQVGVAKLVPLSRLFATASLWVRIQASLKNSLRATLSTGAANTLQTRQKNIQIYKVLFIFIFLNMTCFLALHILIHRL